MNPEQSVWRNKDEIGSHDRDRCMCHPLKKGCCDRWHDEVSDHDVDVIDSSGFGWHMSRACRRAATAARRVFTGARIRYIGNHEGKKTAARHPTKVNPHSSA